MDEDFVHSFVRYSPEEKRNLNLTGLKLLLLNSTKDLSVSSLKNEAYVIRKLIYKMAGPFRRQKHFQWLQRVNRSLSQIQSLQEFTRIASDLIAFESDGSCRCFSGERWLRELQLAKQWLYYASLILKSSVECFKLTFQQLDLELFIPNNLLIVSVMSRMASHMAARLLATVDNFNQLIAGWNEKLKFANSDHSSGVNFSNVYSLFGCDNSTLRDSVKIAKILQEEHRDPAVMSQHLVILRSLLNCKENQLRIEYTKANEQSDSVGTSSATTNLFNWSTSLADDMGEKIVRRIEEPQLKSTTKKKKKINAPEPFNSSVLKNLLSNTKSVKHLKVFKSSLDDSNQTKLSKSKKKKLQKIRIAIDSLLERKKSLGKPELKREFQLLKTKMRNVIGKL